MIQNHKMVDTERELWRSRPTPLLKQGHQVHIAQECMQLGFEYFWRRLNNFSGQPVLMLCHMVHAIPYRHFSKMGYISNPLGRLFHYIRGSQYSWSLSYYCKNNQKYSQLLLILKNTLNGLHFFSWTSRWMKFYPHVSMQNISKSEGRICHYKIFLRNGLYIVLIIRMTN